MYYDSSSGIDDSDETCSDDVKSSNSDCEFEECLSEEHHAVLEIEKDVTRLFQNDVAHFDSTKYDSVSLNHAKKIIKPALSKVNCLSWRKTLSPVILNLKGKLHFLLIHLHMLTGEIPQQYDILSRLMENLSVDKYVFIFSLNFNKIRNKEEEEDFIKKTEKLMNYLSLSNKQVIHSEEFIVYFFSSHEIILPEKIEKSDYFFFLIKNILKTKSLIWEKYSNEDEN